MTLPVERYRSIHIVREFLRSLLDPKKTPRVPKDVRIKAYWCLKHYPGAWEAFKIAQGCPTLLKAEDDT